MTATEAAKAAERELERVDHALNADTGAMRYATTEERQARANMHALCASAYATLATALETRELVKATYGGAV